MTRQLSPTRPTIELQQWPLGTRDWLTRKMSAIDPQFDFEQWVSDIDDWETIQKGVHFLCMDNLLDGSEVLRQMRLLHKLPIQTESQSQRYGYMLQSPGGNHTALYPKTIKALIRKGLKCRRRIEKTHAFFYEHSGCTAKETETWATPEEGVRWYVSLFKSNELLFPGMLVGRPKIYIATIETTTSAVLDSQTVDENIWDEVEPFVLTSSALRRIIKGQNLDMYLPEGQTINLSI